MGLPKTLRRIHNHKNPEESDAALRSPVEENHRLAAGNQELNVEAILNQ